MKNFGELASDESIAKTKKALEGNGFSVLVLENGDEAKTKALEMIPAGAEVMTMSSVTVDSIGLARELNESGKYDSVRKKFETVSSAADKQKLGAAPEWVTGSVHAVTEDGEVLVASATGSQLPAYAYGSLHVLWIVGSQKIVKDLDEGMRRINEYVVPLENERATKAYGRGTSVNKILIFNKKEVIPGRITMIIVKEKLGF